MPMESTKHKKIVNVLKTNTGYARTNDIISSGGIHQRDIKKVLESGTIIKIKKGLYRLTDTPTINNQNFIDVARVVPEGVICLLSALSYYELTTFNPSVISVAIHRKSWRPKIKYPPVEFYCFSPKQFNSGIDIIKINKYEIKIYNKEKTICDCFRYRNKIGVDTVKEGLKEYLKLKNRNLEKLMEYADICRVKPIITTWLNALT
jgi:predicted transcriptional regulator of viral defense system